MNSLGNRAGWGKKPQVGFMQDAVCVNGDTFQQSYTMLTPTL